MSIFFVWLPPRRCVAHPHTHPISTFSLFPLHSLFVSKFIYLFMNMCSLFAWEKLLVVLNPELTPVLLARTNLLWLTNNCLSWLAFIAVWISMLFAAFLSFLHTQSQANQALSLMWAACISCNFIAHGRMVGVYHPLVISHLCRALDDDNAFQSNALCMYVFLANKHNNNLPSIKRSKCDWIDCDGWMMFALRPCLHKY